MWQILWLFNTNNTLIRDHIVMNSITKINIMAGIAFKIDKIGWFTWQVIVGMNWRKIDVIKTVGFNLFNLIRNRLIEKTVILWSKGMLDNQWKILYHNSCIISINWRLKRNSVRGVGYFNGLFLFFFLS